MLAVRKKSMFHSLIESAEFLQEDLLPTRMLWLLADQAVGDDAVLEIVDTREPRGQPMGTLGFEQ